MLSTLLSTDSVDIVYMLRTLEMSDILNCNCNTKFFIMKSATIPPLRVTEDFRHDAESVLREGETLSNFVEEALRKQIEYRKSQQAFIARGLIARDKAKATGQYASKTDVMSSLRSILAKAQQKQ